MAISIWVVILASHNIDLPYGHKDKVGNTLSVAALAGAFALLHAGITAVKSGIDGLRNDCNITIFDKAAAKIQRLMSHLKKKGNNHATKQKRKKIP